MVLVFFPHEEDCNARGEGAAPGTGETEGKVAAAVFGVVSRGGRKTLRPAFSLHSLPS